MKVHMPINKQKNQFRISSNDSGSIIINKGLMGDSISFDVDNENFVAKRIEGNTIKCNDVTYYGYDYMNLDTIYVNHDEMGYYGTSSIYIMKNDEMEPMEIGELIISEDSMSMISESVTVIRVDGDTREIEGETYYGYLYEEEMIKIYAPYENIGNYGPSILYFVQFEQREVNNLFVTKGVNESKEEILNYEAGDNQILYSQTPIISIFAAGEYGDEVDDIPNRTLTYIEIPDSVVSIGERAFDGCSSLASITIPSSVTSIGSSAFEGCSSLTSVIISDSVTSIGDWTFAICSSLTNIIYNGTVALN